MKTIDLSNVQEQQEFARVTPGGYVCVITSVEDKPEKEYLYVQFDIDAGELKGYYRDLYNRHGFWGGDTFRSYKDSALGFFKSFITAVEKSNPGYKWNNDESTLVGKRIGFVLGEEEYEANDGTIKTKIKPQFVHSVDAIQKGEFKVPALKKLKGKNNNLYNKPASIPAGDMSDFAPVDPAADCPFA